MKRIILGVTITCLMILPAFAWAENGFTIAGEISFEKEGNLYLQMATEEEFKEDKNVQLKMIVEVGEEELKARKASFAFEDVPAGTYAITIFQNVDGNGEFKIGKLGPKEPWGTYKHDRPKFSGPKFKKMAFEVKEDMSDISIIVK